jgi:type VI secretion system secreted protein VgrG
MTDTVRSQEKRQMAIATPGDDKLLLVAMHGTETLGRLFHFELDLMSEGAPIDFKTILGQNVTVRVARYDDDVRYFNGYISKFSFAGVEEVKDSGKKLYMYRATMVPWTWFLTRVSDCRIFQEMKVPEIIEKVFRNNGMTDFDNQLTGTYRKWEYCVQYRETDFNFVSRLMENEGIYYYFKHENGKHTLVLCDGASAHSAAPGYASLLADQPDFSSGHDRYLWNWTLGHEVTPNQYALTDFNPLQPKSGLFKSANVSHEHDPGVMEIFDYPGGYVDPGEGREYVAIRMKETEAQYAVGHGTSMARGIYPGATFKLEGQDGFDDAEYLITSVSYQAKSDDMGAGLGKSGGGGSSFVCQITCIPKEYEFRAPRVTPKPLVQGPQTAVVVGPSGEEIHCDKYGRVKVKFHWDREPVMNETASCWIRVSQNVAGKGWGSIQIPRIGQEVIVEFLEGDPDRPIITGRVYNGDNMPPYALPGSATMSSWKSNSSKGGGNFNEIRFEDKKDEEQIFIYAGKNMDVRVKNDRFETVEHNHHVTIQNDYFEKIENKKNVIVASDHMENIQADRHLKVDGKEAVEIASSKSLKVGGNVIEEFGGNHSEVTSGNLFIKATDIVIQGTGSITFKVAGNSIAIDSSGLKITTSGTMDVESTGAMTMKSTAPATFESSAEATVHGMKLTLKADAAGELNAGAKLDVVASGILSCQGAMVKIN